MCLIIYAKKGMTIPVDHLANGFENNEDGVGYALPDYEHNLLRVEKGLWSLDKFMEVMERFAGQEIMVHMRRASGTMPIADDQCHPFLAESGPDFQIPVMGSDGNPLLFTKGENAGKQVTRPLYEFAIMHNGRLPWRSEEGKSDTQCYVEDILRPALSRDPCLMSYVYAHRLVGSHVGVDNKIAIMRYNASTKKTRVDVVNEMQAPAHIKDGIWYSNYSYGYKRASVATDKKGGIDTILESRWRKDGPPFHGTPYVYKAHSSCTYQGGHGATEYTGHMHNPVDDILDGWWQDSDGIWHRNEGGVSVIRSDMPVKKPKEAGKVLLLGDKVSTHDNTNDKVKMPDTTADDFGWYWSGSRRCFVNVNTGVVCDFLGYRKRPTWAPPPVGTPKAIDGKLYEQCGVIVNSLGKVVSGPAKNASDAASTNSSALTKGLAIMPDDAEKTDLKHLCKTDKKALRRVAADYYRLSMGHDKSRGIDASFHIEALRNDMRYCNDDVTMMSVEDLDRFIVSAIEAGVDIAKWLNDKVEEEMREAEIMAAHDSSSKDTTDGSKQVGDLPPDDKAPVQADITPFPNQIPVASVEAKPTEENTSTIK